MQKWFGILLFLTGVYLTASDHSVQFLSTLNYGQLVTSSTLKWVSAENGKIPKNAVIGATRNSPNETQGNEDKNVYICRAMHDAEWIPGQLLREEKSCYISLLGSVKSYNNYEVLQNVDNGSRLIWKDWDTYQSYPTGIVAGGTDFYIARKKLGEPEENDVSSQTDEALKSVKGYSHYVGKFNSKDSFGKMTILTEDKQEKEFIIGQLLIESEPVRYELNNVKYTVFRRKVKKEKKLLAFSILRNTEMRPLNVDSALAYNSTYFSYWGQGNAMLKGLDTVIRNATTGKIITEIEWGIEEEEERKDIYRVEAFLQPGTAINVTLYGNETQSELPYIGTLVSIYKDDATTARKLEGSRKLIEMVDVKPVWGPVYFISNNSLIPTTTTTTTTSTTTTTTTPTTTTTTSTTTTVLPIAGKIDTTEISNINNNLPSKNHNNSSFSENEKNMHTYDEALFLTNNKTKSNILISPEPTNKSSLYFSCNFIIYSILVYNFIKLLLT